VARTLVFDRRRLDTLPRRDEEAVLVEAADGPQRRVVGVVHRLADGQMRLGRTPPSGSRRSTVSEKSGRRAASGEPTRIIPFVSFPVYVPFASLAGAPVERVHRPLDAD
jgi:hypothetical protein